MEAHASARDWVKIGGLRHKIEPTARAFRERFGFNAEVLGVAAVEEGGQVHFRSKAACKTPHCPSDTRERRGVVLHAGQAHGFPERQPIRANSVACKPAEVCRLDQRKPVPPAFRATLQTVV